jgi:hypothetical protein
MPPQPRYQVSRSGKVIGVFDGGEMIAKVATGQVLPTDFYWTAGMSAWLHVGKNEEWMRHAAPVQRPMRSYPAGTMVCTQCGCTGTESHTKGSFMIELVLWLFMCVPGLIYSIWRLTTRGQVCSSCKSDRLVPASSPAGQRLLSNP